MASLPPEIVQSTSKYVSFKLDPSIVHTEKDRTELAYTKEYFPFGKTIHIGFDFMLPEDASETNDFFYVLQLWQGNGYGPIAGVRIKRGTSHYLQFITANDLERKTRVGYELTPNKWHHFVISLRADATGAGSFVVRADGKEIGRYSGPIGHLALDPHFRVKFGIYKGHEQDRYFEVNYDNLRIANRYRFVNRNK
ncbi:MAG: heparin lyase I family protein [Bdellovibrionaceae bacterium]|nr:heparin lyase I family protein [Pseudobdellovibrionaceae bacterium]